MTSSITQSPLDNIAAQALGADAPVDAPADTPAVPAGPSFEITTLPSSELGQLPLNGWRAFIVSGLSALAPTLHG